MLIRHCDVCNEAFEKDQVYIRINLESDGDSGICVGLPLNLQGDFCSIRCLRGVMPT